MKKQRLLIEAVRYITGAQSSMKLKGDSEELRAFRKVLNASRKLYESLHDKNVSLKKIEQLVENKKRATRAFENLTGETWPL